MSMWSYINGVITVNPMGRTTAEKRYILDTVLAHLPIVNGSEGDMQVSVVPKNGWDAIQDCDEFYQQTNNLQSIDTRDRYSTRNGYMEICSEYMIVVDASLRDRVFDETKRMFLKWLSRLAKRVCVDNVLVRISDWSSSLIIDDDNGAFYNMYEWPSWTDEGESNWCEYLMWKPYVKDGEVCEFPEQLYRKYGTL